MKHKYTVYTDSGDWTDIWAYDERGAARQVLTLTFGRAVIQSVRRAS